MTVQGQNDELTQQTFGGVPGKLARSEHVVAHSVLWKAAVAIGIQGQLGGNFNGIQS